MQLIGLTGGIATGKSTVSRILQDELRVPVVDADVIAREVVEPGRPAYQRIVKVFGEEVVHPDTRAINRDALGKIIFGDEAKRKQLNAIVHPAVFRAMFWAVARHYMRGERLVVLDVPLLFEGGTLLKFLRKTVVVFCDPEKQLARLMERNQFAREDAESRIRAQMPIEEKKRRADILIDNNGSVEETRSQVKQVVAQLQRNWSFPAPAVLLPSIALAAAGLYKWMC